MSKKEKFQVFGVDLNTSKQIPRFLINAFRYMEKNLQEGLYRVSGNDKKVADMIKLIKSGKEINFEKFGVHNVTAVIKEYFLAMPNRLLSSSEKKLFKAIKIKDAKKRSEKIRKIVGSSSKCMQIVLVRLFKNISIVRANEKITKMNLKNCVMVFLPVLFNEHESTAETIDKTEKEQNLIRTLIEDYDLIFKPK